MDVVGVGTDIESVGSFRRKPYESNLRFYRRVFSKHEIEYCLKFKDPYPHFAARFCAKEAMVKASSEIAKSFVTDFEVKNERSGRPDVFPRKKTGALRSFFIRYSCKLSISHTDDLAVAVAVITEKKRI